MRLSSPRLGGVDATRAGRESRRKARGSPHVPRAPGPGVMKKRKISVAPASGKERLARAVEGAEGLNRQYLHERCGVFGVYGVPDAARYTYLGLYALQHRGQESAGIAVSDGKVIRLRKGMGLVRTVFADPQELSRLNGDMAIGHNRYSTTGTPGPVNAQPVLIRYKRGQLGAAHNGNLVNAAPLRRALEEEGSIFQTSSDTEVILHLVARSRKRNVPEMILEALGEVEGAYSLVILTEGQLIAARDPHGFRPLCMGRFKEGYVVASESCAFDIIGAEYLRSVDPGEMIVVEGEHISCHRIPRNGRTAYCIFEFVYFSRPDSMIFGQEVDTVRRSFGRQLASEHPCEADVVISVPDSANTAALGYSQESGIPFEIGLIRNHYVGRTFILPEQRDRDSDVRVKFNPVGRVLRGKRVVLVEDSIVRGTTLRQLIGLVRSVRPAEVHVRVSSPPIRYPCYYGIDMPRQDELIAARLSVEQTREYVGADSLAYLSVESMLGCVAGRENYCTCCFTGEYRTEVPEHFHKRQFEPIPPEHHQRQK